MSDLTIRNCVFAFKCNAVWDDLDDTDEDSIKFCQDCLKEVHYCANDLELAHAVKLNRCVAIEKESGSRWLGDIDLGLIKPIK